MKIRQKGFTLIEILLVMILIGILASIVLVAINPNRQLAQGRNLKRKADINNINNALEYYSIKNQGSIPNVITNIYQEICDTGTRSITDSLPNTNYCDGKIDLRLLVPTYISSIPKDSQATSTGSTGYELAKNNSNKISIISKNYELGQSIVINPPTPEELIQAQIAAGTLVPTGTQQLVLERLVYKNNAGTQTYIDKATTTKVCPTGYISVPGNSMYGTSDFCVAKYEMKAVAISAPTVGLTTPNTGFNTIDNNTTATTSANGRAIASVPSGYPIANINQPTAASYCTTAGASLISNAEWMTIARNIEGQLSNWTTGTAASTAIGTGGLYRGHSDATPNTALEAGADNDGYIGTGQSGFSIERRTHTLSNGEVIWDLGGNMWEWTSDTILGKDQPTGSTPGFNWRQYTAITNYGTLSYDLIRPSNNTWNSTQNMGQIYSDGTSTNNTSYAFLRGGSWNITSSVGVFALILLNAPTISYRNFGFRCVLR